MAVSGEVECAVSASRMWRAAFEDGQTCLPKALPQAISHVSYDGPGFAAGSIRTIHLLESYAEQQSQQLHSQQVVSLVKDQLQEVENKNYKMKGKFLEGGFLGVLLKSYTQFVHIEGTGPDTCLVHWSVEYEPLSEGQTPQITAVFGELVPTGYRAIEAYLLNHDDYKNEM